MQSLKIVITLLILIALGIVVGSNLLPTMTVMILNQPTITLPIGVWLAISIGLGLLSSSSIQLLLFAERRLRDRQIRQLKSRLQQLDDNVFTYTSDAPKPKYQTDQPSQASTESPNPKRSIFSSYRASFANNFTRKKSTQPIDIDDRDDWDGEFIPNQQPDWDDVPLPPRQQQVSNNFEIPREQGYANPRSQSAARDPDPIYQDDDVYDADFRLIQPPYKEPTAAELDDFEAEEEEFEYSEPERDKNRDFSNTSSSNNSEEEEDWGFDFDEEDTPVQNSKPRDRKI